MRTILIVVGTLAAIGALVYAALVFLVPKKPKATASAAAEAAAQGKPAAPAPTDKTAQRIQASAGLLTALSGLF